jgi:hypothetical protein
MFTAALIGTALAVASADPAKPVLPHSFQALIGEPGSPSFRNITVDMAEQFVVAWQFAEPFEKTIGSGVSCKLGEAYNFWPYFEEVLCFAHKQTMPGDQCMTEYMAQYLPIGPYVNATYNGTVSVNDTSYETWVASTKMEEKININCQGKVVPATLTMSHSYVYGFKDKDVLGMIETTTQEVITGCPSMHPNPPFTQKMFITKMVTPAPMNGPPADCVDMVTDGFDHPVLPPFFKTEKMFSQRVGTQEEIDRINSVQSSWVAGHNDFFPGASFAEASKVLGTFMVPPGYSGLQRSNQTLDTSAIPDSFDARTQWPDCPIIGTIRNQGGCGSCWAFAVTTQLEGAIAIKRANTPSRLSEQQLVDCTLRENSYN